MGVVGFHRDKFPMSVKGDLWTEAPPDKSFFYKKLKNFYILGKFLIYLSSSLESESAWSMWHWSPDNSTKDMAGLFSCSTLSTCKKSKLLNVEHYSLTTKCWKSTLNPLELSHMDMQYMWNNTYDQQWFWNPHYESKLTLSWTKCLHRARWLVHRQLVAIPVCWFIWQKVSWDSLNNDLHFTSLWNDFGSSCLSAGTNTKCFAPPRLWYFTWDDKA